MRRRTFIRTAAGIFVPSIIGRAQIPLSVGDPAFLGRRRVVSGSSPQPPLTDLLAWWTAGSIGASNGSSLSAWSDSSGHGNNLTQSTSASQPTFATNQINSLPAVRFTSQFFNVPNFVGSLTAAEIFAIIQLDSDPPGSGGNTGIWNWGGTTAERTHFPWTDGTIYDNFFTSARLTTVNPTPSLASWRCWNITAAESGTTWRYRLDGTQIYTSTSTFTASSWGGNFVGVSESLNTTQYFLSGWIAEILFYGVALSSGTRSSANSYLATKYGLTIA